MRPVIGLIRVLTTANAEVLHEHGRLISEMYAVPVKSDCIPEQPLGIYNDETEQLANPKIVALGKRMEQDGCKVLVVSCAADPAAAAKTLMEQGIEVIVFACTGFSTIGLAGILRKELNIPVIDAVEAEGLIASNLYKQLSGE